MTCAIEALVERKNKLNRSKLGEALCVKLPYDHFSLSEKSFIEFNNIFIHIHLALEKKFDNTWV